MDTSAFFAFIAPRDTSHEQAIRISRGLANQSWRLFTSNYMLSETHALLLSRLGRAIALTFLQEIERSTTQVVRATAADERRAKEIIERYTDKDFSLADAISSLLDNPQAASEMGQRGRRRVESSYSWDRVVANTEQVYAQVTSR